MTANVSPSGDAAKLRALTLAAIGVVYGDIGTSPLYTIRECFTQTGMAVSPANVMGVLSLIFWALIIVVTVKYVVFVMRADNQGEGGVLALMALAMRGLRPGRRTTAAVLAAGVLGAALFYGDCVITPAISVLSAVEGLTVAAPWFEPYVIPLALVILTGLFVAQQHGTARVGALFGPVIVVWFLTLATLGAVQIAQTPEVLAALSPAHALRMLTEHGALGFTLLGAVVLAVTGGEALYADMGHFGRFPIRLAWFGLVLPALLINYFGQGALLLNQPAAIENPFYLSAPDWALYPLIGLATAATVIASQAVISGAFSITLQAIHLRFLPRMQVRHTSAQERGQIYLPAVNWLLFAGVVGLILAFKTSSNLAAAYGVAVTGTMVVTTLLAYKVARRLGGWSLARAAAALALFLTVDLAFFTSNLAKVFDGGWFPLAVAAALVVAMTTWRRGRAVLTERLAAASVPVDVFLARLKGGSTPRVPGAAVFLTSNPRGLPPSLLHNLKHNKVLHERVVLLTVETAEIPHIAAAERFELTSLSGGFYRLIARYGFMEEPDLPAALRAGRIPGLPFETMETTYFVSRETLIPTRNSGLPAWREGVFIALSRVSASASEYFRIPPGRVVELGMQIEI